MPPPRDRLKETPSQTAGPFVHIGLAPALAVAAGEAAAGEGLGAVVAGPRTPGRRIRIAGCVRDGDGTPVRDVVIETWQADASGVYASPADPRHAACAPDFVGWGRVAADLATGDFAFETVKPGPVPGPGGTTMAPHIALWIVARGINIGLATRLYFSDEAAANADDPVLRRIESPDRRATLIARLEGAAGGPDAYRFDIRLQGDDETVFFAT